MDGFERRKEQKKDSIRRAAIELFRTYGFDKVSIADIARKARVSHVTIYNHFGSKDELVQDVIRTAISGLVERSREILDSGLPYLEKLEALVFGKVETAGQYQGELMRTAVRDNPEIEKFIDTMWKNEINTLIIDLVDEGRRLGYIDPEISGDAILYYFDIIRTGAFASSEMLAKIKVNAGLARDLNYLFLYGLVNKKP